MQTVYILKDSNKSYRALLQLYNSAELSTNIIIVNKFYSKMLLLDKRVKSFPFIINTLPTSIGLVPKFAKVLPLELFLQIRGSSSKKNNCKEFYEYYFEPVGTTGMVFFQFMDDNLHFILATIFMLVLINWTELLIPIPKAKRLMKKQVSLLLFILLVLFLIPFFYIYFLQIG